MDKIETYETYTTETYVTQAELLDVQKEFYVTENEVNKLKEEITSLRKTMAWYTVILFMVAMVAIGGLFYGRM